MKQALLSIIFIAFFGIVSRDAIAAPPADGYKQKLALFKVILSETDENMVMEWLLDPNSGYPDLANRLLTILNHTNPKGTSTVLQTIMGKYRIVSHRSPNDYIHPPYTTELIKQAYVKNWAERNSAEWQRLPNQIKNDYRRAFLYITQ